MASVSPSIRSTPNTQHGKVRASAMPHAADHLPAGEALPDVAAVGPAPGTPVLPPLPSSPTAARTQPPAGDATMASSDQLKRLAELRGLVELFEVDPILANEVLKTKKSLVFRNNNAPTPNMSHKGRAPIPDEELAGIGDEEYATVLCGATAGGEACRERVSAMERRGAQFPFGLLLKAERTSGIPVHTMQTSMSDLDEAIAAAKRTNRALERDISRWELVRYHGESIGVQFPKESMEERSLRHQLIESALQQQLLLVKEEVSAAKEKLARHKRKLLLLKAQVASVGAENISPVARMKTASDLRACIKQLHQKSKTLALEDGVKEVERQRERARLDRQVEQARQRISELQDAAKKVASIPHGAEVDARAAKLHEQLLQTRAAAAAEEQRRALDEAEAGDRKALVSIWRSACKVLQSSMEIDRVRCQRKQLSVEVAATTGSQQQPRYMREGK